MFNLTPLSTEHLIDIAGIIATVITIIISVVAAKSAVKNAIYELKAENSLKEISSLPEIVINFIDSIKSLMIYTYLSPDEAKKEETSLVFDSALSKLQDTLLMYGSASSIKVLYEIISRLRRVAAGAEEMKIADLFSLLLLLYAQIRYDLTNEKIRLNSYNVYFDLLFPEIAYYKKDVLLYAGKNRI